MNIVELINSSFYVHSKNILKEADVRGKLAKLSFMEQRLINYLLKGAADKDNLGKDFIVSVGNSTDEVRCSLSAINNLIKLLREGKECVLHLGNFINKNRPEDYTTYISHVWVATPTKTYETGKRPPDGVGYERNPVLSISFIPDDLNDLENILKANLK